MTNEFYMVCLPEEDIKIGPIATYNEAIKEAERLSDFKKMPAYVLISIRKVEQVSSFKYTELTR